MFWSPSRRWPVALAATVAALLAAAQATSVAQTVPPTTTTTTTMPFRTSPYVTFKASPTSNLTAGMVIQVEASGAIGAITEFSAQICYGACATEAPGPDADALVVKRSDDLSVGYLAIPFRVGVGTFRTATGEPFVCDATHPCQLQVSAYQGRAFHSAANFDLTYLDSARPTTTTTTTRPNHALCAARDRFPGRLWRFLIAILGITC
jgi:hypothetical protein